MQNICILVGWQIVQKCIGIPERDNLTDICRPELADDRFKNSVSVDSREVVLFLHNSIAMKLNGWKILLLTVTLCCACSPLAGQEHRFVEPSIAAVKSPPSFADCETIVRKLEYTACTGGHILFNRQRLAAGTDQQFVYKTSADCDSIIHVRVHALPPLTFEVQTDTVCWNSSEGYLAIQKTAGGVPPYRYSIDKRHYQSLPNFKHLEGGLYTVYIKDSQGCRDSSLVNIPAIEPLQYRVEDRIIQCDQDSIYLEVELFSDHREVQYKWPDGTTLPYFKVGKPDVYWVTISNQCESNFEEVLVGLGEQQAPAYMYLPNAFSPNSDSYNDSYKAYPASGAEVIQYELSLFDRTGTRVFYTKDMTQAWDGTHLGQNLEAGVYMAVLKARVAYCYREIEVNREGPVTLHR